MKIYKKPGFIFLALLFCSFFSFKTTGLYSQSLPALPQVLNSEPENTLEAELNRLKSLYEDQVILEGRLKEGADETKQEIEKTKYFLEITQVSPEEFKPFLKKWEVLLSSYQSVLQDTQSQMEQLEQQQIRIDSNLRMYKLKMVDIKSQLQNDPQDPNLKNEWNTLQSNVKIYSKIETELDNSLRLISKNLSDLQNTLNQCKQYFNQVNARWENTRFSRLTYRALPLITKDTFTLIHHELVFLLLETKNHLLSFKDSFLESFNQWKERFPLYLFFIPLSAFLSLASFSFKESS